MSEEGASCGDHWKYGVWPSPGDHGESLEGLLLFSFVNFLHSVKNKTTKSCVNTVLELHLWTSFLWEHSIEKGKNHTPFKKTLPKSEFLC